MQLGHLILEEKRCHPDNVCCAYCDMVINLLLGAMLPRRQQYTQTLEETKSMEA